mmetsp:Transcript_14601/g.17045  ORF Transcript_14601/g.17045 Transcript_14601/m.17045 type:complete len:299 (+) Transcript_14601:529-1425(+)
MDKRSLGNFFPKSQEKGDLEKSTRKRPKLSNSTVAEPIQKTNLQSALNAVIEGDLVPALGLVPGVRMQVQWFLESEEEKSDDSCEAKGPKDKETWWGCTLVGSSGEKHKLSDGDESKDNFAIKVYQLKYDALEPHYPKETISNICFMNEEELLDIEYDGLLKWRREEPQKEPDSNSTSIPANPELLAAIRKFEKDHDVGKLRRALLESKSADDDIIPVPDGQTRESAEQLVNTILAGVLSTHFKRLKLLPATTQYSMADRVSKVKNLLVERITLCLDTKKILDTEAVNEIVKDVLKSI